MTTFSYEETEYRYNPYTKQMEQIDLGQDVVDGLKAEIELNKDNIALNITELDSKADTATIIAEINLSSEGVDIKGKHIKLDGDVNVDGTFSITSIGDAGVLATKDIVDSTQLGTTTKTDDGIYITSKGITGYYGGNKSIDINTTTGDATFTGNINAKSGTFEGDITSTATITGGVFTTEDGATDDKVVIENGRITFFDGIENVGAIKSRPGEIYISENLGIGGDITTNISLELNRSIRLINDNGTNGYIKMTDTSTTTDGYIRFSNDYFSINSLTTTSLKAQDIIFGGGDILKRATSGILQYKGNDILDSSSGLKLSGGTMSGNIDMDDNHLEKVNVIYVNQLRKNGGGEIDVIGGFDLAGNDIKAVTRIYVNRLYNNGSGNISLYDSIDGRGKTISDIKLDIDTTYDSTSIYVATSSGGSATTQIHVVPIKVNGTTRYMLAA